MNVDSYESDTAEFLGLAIVLDGYSPGAVTRAAVAAIGETYHDSGTADGAWEYPIDGDETEDIDYVTVTVRSFREDGTLFHREWRYSTNDRHKRILEWVSTQYQPTRGPETWGFVYPDNVGDK